MTTLRADLGSDLQQVSDSSILVPKYKLEAVLDFAAKCKAFAKECEHRVEMLEDYRKEADAQLGLASKEVQMLQDELTHEETKNKFLFPGLALLLGAVVGFAVSK